MANTQKNVRLRVGLSLAVLLCGLIAAGVTSVLLQAEQLQEVKQNVVMKAAKEVAAQLTLELQFALTPLRLAAQTTSRTPGPQLLALPQDTLADWVNLAPCSQVTFMFLAYSGIVVLAYPPSPLHFNSFKPELTGLPSWTYDNAVYGMKTGRTIIQDLAALGVSNDSAIMVASPAFARAASARETWGWPANMTEPMCADNSLPCYNASTGLKWWGQVGILLGRDRIASCQAVANARESGYGYRIALIQDTPGLMTPAALYPTELFTHDWVGNGSNCLSDVSYEIGEVTPGISVYVEMCMTSDWDIEWKAGALVGVVLGAALLVGLTAWAMSSWMRTSELMHTLLPADTIQMLARNMASRIQVRDPQDEIIGTPAEKMVTMLSMLAAGEEPPMTEVLTMLTVLKQQRNIYIPADLQEHVAMAAGMDEEVAAALMAQLAGGNNPATDGPTGMIQTTLSPPAATTTHYNRTSNAFLEHKRLSLSKVLKGDGVRTSGADKSTLGFESTRTSLTYRLFDDCARSHEPDLEDVLMMLVQGLEAVRESVRPDAEYDEETSETESHLSETEAHLTGHGTPTHQLIKAARQGHGSPTRGENSNTQNNRFPVINTTEDIMSTSQSVTSTSSGGGGAPAEVAGAGPALTRSISKASSMRNRRSFVDVWLPRSAASSMNGGVGSPLGAVTVELNSAHGSGPTTSLPSRHLSAFPGRSVVTQVESVLLGADSLSGDFDAWQLSACSHNHPLSCLGYWCFHRSGVITDMGISPQPLIRFLRAVESGYNNNPYHNRTHAADVLQSVHALLHSGGLRGTYADSFTVVACYLAAIIHDYDHRGVTNDFLINTRHDLALTHNDRSPHENHHLSAGFFLLTQPHCNFLNHLPQAEWLRMRKLVIELVLATDMKQHFAVNGAFASLHRIATAANVKRIVDSRPTTKHSSVTDAPNSNRQIDRVLVVSGSALTGSGSNAQQPGVSASTATSSQSNVVRFANTSITMPTPPVLLMRPSHVSHMSERKTRDSSTSATTRSVRSSLERRRSGSLRDSPRTSTGAPVDETDRMLGLQMLMKCADLGHICTHLPTHLKWVAALEEEMFMQGDQERALGLPISPLCDRNGLGVTKSQVGFFEVVVLPLITNFSVRFPTAQPIVTTASANYNYWREMAGHMSH